MNLLGPFVHLACSPGREDLNKIWTCKIVFLLLSAACDAFWLKRRKVLVLAGWNISEIKLQDSFSGL